MHKKYAACLDCFPGCICHLLASWLLLLPCKVAAFIKLLWKSSKYCGHQYGSLTFKQPARCVYFFHTHASLSLYFFFFASKEGNNTSCLISQDWIWLHLNRRITVNCRAAVLLGSLLKVQKKTIALLVLLIKELGGHIHVGTEPVYLETRSQAQFKSPPSPE